MVTETEPELQRDKHSQRHRNRAIGTEKKTITETQGESKRHREKAKDTKASKPPANINSKVTSFKPPKERS